MKKITLLCVGLLLLIGCGRSLPVVKGEGQVLSKERKLPAYTQVRLECDLPLYCDWEVACPLILRTNLQKSWRFVSQ